MGIQLSDLVENIVGKEEIAHYEQFEFELQFILSSINALDMDNPVFSLHGEGLTVIFSGCFTCASEQGLRVFNVDPLTQKLCLGKCCVVVDISVLQTARTF